MQITQSLRRAARMQPLRVGVQCGARAVTWAQMLRRAPRIAGALRAAGVDHGDRVAVLAMNSDRYAELLYAVPWAGAVIVPLNIRWAPAEIAYAMQEAGAAVLIVDTAFAPMVEELRKDPALRRIFFLDDGEVPAGCASFEEAVAQAAPVEDAGRQGDDLYAIFYTGGTTGHPKGVMLSHRNALSLAWSWLAAHPPGETAVVHMHVAGLFHLAGAAYVWYTTAAAGTNVMLPKFEAEPVMQAISRHKVNSVVLIPTMVNMLLAHPAFDDYDLASVRTCIYGGAPIPHTLLLTAMEKLPTWRFIQAYGMTETAGMATTLPACYHVLEGEMAQKIGSAGRASAVCEVRIVDPAGEEVPLGQVGEIAIRGDNVMLGYWNDDAATARVLRDGWMHSGDAARMDEDGFIYIVDRVKDMIVSGGENVYSAEVENAVHRHPAVLECAVIGIPDDKWGEAVHAVVVTREGRTVSQEELMAHCRTLIAGYKCPRSMDISANPLPKTAAGKIAKNPLREPFWVGRSRRVH
ncbi:Long-chain-fatty-acid--CoA ligase (plasmid) [Variovorax sp. SRS16]|uniref:acyl-CoA synthetase n=1 Tax=Variovorax sp. SRS16 TaxID=282217 RepID=UPI001315B762|nr:long-chain fatty acid--CoA ligase [Variovorax sp. SRS16]VTU45526.1 Long-chain-fatty-acid--CoA ligase [Variovorax sp. SRS16]